MLRRAAVGGALLIAALICPAARAQDAYPERVMDGLRHLRAGQPVDAAGALQEAFRLDANHPAAWSAYGVLMLDLGRTAEAEQCFRRAATAAPADPSPRLGLALCALARKDLKAAGKHLADAEARHASVAAPSAYVAALAGDTDRARAALLRAPDAPLTDAVRAYLAGTDARASAEAWRAALRTADAATSSHDPLLATFDAAAPLARAWQPNRAIPGPPRPAGKPISGVMTLGGESGPDVVSVSVTIDGSLAGATNVPPFTWSWNTAQYANGMHLVRVTVRRRSGAETVRESRVQTRNAGAAEAPAYAGMDNVNAMLAAALDLPPDPRYARMALARAAVAAGNTREARRRLEAVVGDDPLYRNAADMLKTLPRTATAAEIWRGPAGAKRIALTFDDGPNPRETPPLLDVLAALNVPATFFVVGKQAASYPDIVRRMAREGHEVENHTWNHRNLRHLTSAQALAELASTRRIITMLTGRPTRYFRPPGGNTSAAARRSAEILDMAPAMWTFASGKTEGLPLEEMVPRFVRGARPGAIYLIHNGTRKIEALLPLVVKQLRARGYTFVTLEELMTGAAAPVPMEHAAAPGSVGG